MPRLARAVLLPALAFALCAICALPAGAADGKKRHTVQRQPHGKQVGKASYYAKKFAGRKMADGSRMDPESDNAASKTLPLGSRARVTNLDTGDSAEVTIRDRGPHVRGRIIDVSPATARQIGLTRQRGVARVAVEPITQDGGSANIPNAPAAEPVTTTD